MAEQTPKAKKPSDGNQEQLEPFVVFLDETSHNCAPIHRALESAEIEFVQHGSKFRSGEFDEVWLPVVGNAGWAVLTCDKRIRYNQLEREKIIEHRIREFVFTSGVVHPANLDSQGPVFLYSCKSQEDLVRGAISDSAVRPVVLLLLDPPSDR